MDEVKCEYDSDFGCSFEEEYSIKPDEIDCIFCIFSSLEHITHQLVELLGHKARLTLVDARRVLLGLCLHDRKIASSIAWLKKHYPEKWQLFKELHEKQSKEMQKEEEKYRRMQKEFFAHLTGKKKTDLYRV